MVGTRWVCVTLCRSTSRSVSSASQASISTTVTPHRSGTAKEKARGAAWYRGPVHRCTSWPGRYP